MWVYYLFILAFKFLPFSPSTDILDQATWIHAETKCNFMINTYENSEWHGNVTIKA